MPTVLNFAGLRAVIYPNDHGLLMYTSLATTALHRELP